MIKRSMLSAIIILLSLSILAGCTRMLESDYMVQTTHSDQSGETPDSNAVLTVNNYDALVGAVLSFVTEGQKQGVVRLSNYAGDADKDMQKVGTEIRLEIPLGAYAVDYITYESNRILSYYEMTVNITYKKTKKQIDEIISVLSVARLDDEIANAVRGSVGYLAVEISSDTVSESGIAECITNLYYENPLSVMFLPRLTVNMYPGNTHRKIIEMEFEYPYTAYRIERMRLGMYDDATAILGDIIGSAEEKALDICLALMEHVEYRETPEGGDDWSHEYTAYGAITEGAACPEGYAMAFKLLCDIAEIDCVVVIGRLDGVSHAWNIVKIDGEYYHIDPSMCDYEGIETAFLKRDEDMWGRYWWDTEKYEACNGSMTYWSLVNEEAFETIPEEGTPEE